MQPESTPPVSDERTMLEKGIDLLADSALISRARARLVLESLLDLWKNPTWDVATSPRECTKLFSDEMAVVRGAETDFGQSWTQQICKILSERQDRIDAARRAAEMNDDGA